MELKNNVILNEEQGRVLSLIPKDKASAITSKDLMSLTGFSFRGLKAIISELRRDYPICSKETDGGGYWIAENKDDVREFISMIARRRDGYNNTIDLMQNYMEME